MRRLTPLLAAVLVAACGASEAASVPGPLRVVAAEAGPDTRLTLEADAGYQINARLAPALELADGQVLRFDAAARTADSAYFAEPPTAHLAGRHAAVHGTLRASVCQTGERVCRSLTLPI